MRVLAIAEDASLEVALAITRPDWEIAAARTAERAAEEGRSAGLALVDFGTTERGLRAVRALRRLEIAIPCVVVGDAPADVEPNVVLLVRPFTLADLTAALDLAATLAAQTAGPLPAGPGPPAPAWGGSDPVGLPSPLASFWSGGAEGSGDQGATADLLAELGIGGEDQPHPLEDPPGGARATDESRPALP